MIGIALFILATLAILRLSWHSLHSLKAHGFYRFFAFEFIACLIIVNLPFWFHDPWSERQIGSYIFGAISIGLAAEGFRLLIMIGKPSSSAVQDTYLAFENTTRLVRVGAFRFIRHPLYASLFALVICTWLKAPLSAINIALAFAAGGFLLATALAEEKENLARFGAEYAEYMKRTRRFVPFLF
jgi:protein-S-isoprenylcysteine O-methyltransferase Ste14